MTEEFQPTPEIQNRVTDNLTTVKNQMAAACSRADRAADSVRLIAVTKYAELSWMLALLNAGATDFGENRPQQLAERTPQFPASIQWHMIGQLQRNKVKTTLQNSGIIHSVDSWRLLDRIQFIANEISVQPKVLLEVNISGESAKSGFSQDELQDKTNQLADYTGVEICGLMTMAPIVETAEHARPVFAGLRQLRDALQAADSRLTMPELSMGMSGDFEVAIEEGATMVRIGSRLFAGCPSSNNTNG